LLQVVLHLLLLLWLLPLLLQEVLEPPGSIWLMQRQRAQPAGTAMRCESC
jgi:hypothetical protein